MVPRSDPGTVDGGDGASKSIAVAPQTPGDAGTQAKPRQPEKLGSSAENFSLGQIKIAAIGSGSNSVRAILLLAFVAGFLLNLMPCALPVVGLKLLSFVQRANDCRRRVLLLNVAYSAELKSVMLVLATSAVFAGLGWGEQFSSTAFSVTIAAVVFAFVALGKPTNSRSSPRQFVTPVRSATGPSPHLPEIRSLRSFIG